MQQQLKFYALKLKNSNILIKFEVDKREDDIDRYEIYTLTSSDFVPNIWVTSEFEVAKRVSNETNVWYNADYNSPINQFKGQLEIVEFKAILKN